MCCYFCFVYCLLDLSCCECNVISLYFLWCSVNGSVCLVCCVSDSVSPNNSQYIGCCCYFVVECYGSVECGLRCSVG